MAPIEVTVNTAPYKEFKLYQRKNFKIYPGLNSLVGCNGSGKTTFLDMYLIPQLRKQHIEYYKYNDRRQGGSALMEAMLNCYDDLDGLMQMYMSSEGERIVCGIVKVIQALPHFLKENRNKSAVLLLDSIDSGMSVDEIIEIREVLLNTIIPDAKERFNSDLYIVIAANNYEWCNDDRIVNIDITNSKTLKFDSYEDYVKHIRKSRNRKDNSRGITQ